MKTYKEKLEAISHRRFDLMKLILESKKELKELQKSYHDVYTEWEDNRIEEAFDWLYGMNTIYSKNYFTMVAKWEYSNPGWVVSGGSVRRSQRSKRREKQ